MLFVVSGPEQRRRVLMPSFSPVYSVMLSACMPNSFPIFDGKYLFKALSMMSPASLWNRQKLLWVSICNYIHGDSFVQFQTLCLLWNTWSVHLFVFICGVNAWVEADNSLNRSPSFVEYLHHLFENASSSVLKYSTENLLERKSLKDKREPNNEGAKSC